MSESKSNRFGSTTSTLIELFIKNIAKGTTDSRVEFWLPK